MFKTIQKVLAALILVATTVFAASPETPVVRVPLLPTDDGNNVAFTKESFKALLATPGIVSKERSDFPVLSSVTSAENPIIQAVGFLLTDRTTRTSGQPYLEGAPPPGGGILEGWKWTESITGVARSTYGEIGLALLEAYKHYNDATLLGRIRTIAANLAADKTAGGPLSATNKPFMPDVLFLAMFESSGLKDDATDYLIVAQSWFDNITKTGDQEVDRIIAARATQGLPELSGYDIAYLLAAAEAVVETTFVTAAKSRLATLAGSWEVNGAGTTDAQARTSTGNMLSRGALVWAGAGETGWEDFLVGTPTQRSGEGTFNGYNSDGSFLPAGNIQSNSLIVAGLGSTTGYYGPAVKGCKYLIETQNMDGLWLSYPMFGGTEVYPSETAAALFALSNTAYVLEVTNVKDREGSVALSDIPVQIENQAGQTTSKTTVSGTVGFPAILDTVLTVSFPVDATLRTSLQATYIGSYDASLVLEQALETSPFSVNNTATYGNAAKALMAANLAKAAGFTGADVTSQIGAEILRFAVSKAPQYTAYFDLNFDDNGALAPSISYSYNHSGVGTLSNYNMILLGDIDNTMESSGGLSGGALLAGALGFSPMKVSLQHYKIEEDNLVLPVLLSEFGKGMKAPKAFQFEVIYNADALSYSGFRLGEVTSNFLYAENGAEAGLIKVAMAGGSGVMNNGAIAYLEFKLADGAGRLEDFSIQNILIDDLPGSSETNISIAAIAGEARLPKAYSLSQNAPNPFNPSTSIQYTIPVSTEAVKVRLTIYNVRGHLVKTLIEAEQQAGNYSVNWDGRNMKGQMVSSGVYFYRIKAGKFSQVRKMIVLK